MRSWRDRGAVWASGCACDVMLEMYTMLKHHHVSITNAAARCGLRCDAILKFDMQSEFEPPALRDHALAQRPPAQND